MDFQLKDKVAVVTGGSRGIGRAPTALDVRRSRRACGDLWPHPRKPRPNGRRHSSQGR